MGILYKILNLFFKGIKLILLSLLVILLLPIIVVKYLFVLYVIITSPPNYEQRNSKANAIYEALEMPISCIKEFYYQCLNKKASNNDITKSKFEKNLIRGIVYTIGIVLFIGPALNMYISGYYILNKESIMQKNIQLEQEIAKIKEDFRAYGKVYNTKSISFNSYDKIEKIEDFIFENQTREMEDFFIKTMEKNNFKLVNIFNKDKMKVLSFKKNQYISEMHFSENKEVKITLRRYDSFRESKLYDILSPLILVTSPLNPFRRFEVFNFSW